MERSAAYEPGREDFAAGHVQLDNPFDMKTPEWSEWREGFLDALEQDVKLPNPNDDA
jgi:hypothetical protein